VIGHKQAGETPFAKSEGDPFPVDKANAEACLNESLSTPELGARRFPAQCPPRGGC